MDEPLEEGGQAWAEPECFPAELESEDSWFVGMNLDLGEGEVADAVGALAVLQDEAAGDAVGEGQAVVGLQGEWVFRP